MSIMDFCIGPGELFIVVSFGCNGILSEALIAIMDSSNTEYMLYENREQFKVIFIMTVGKNTGLYFYDLILPTAD
jgi:hypothetical protein